MDTNLIRNNLWSRRDNCFNTKDVGRGNPLRTAVKNLEIVLSYLEFENKNNYENGTKMTKELDIILAEVKDDEEVFRSGKHSNCAWVVTDKRALLLFSSSWSEYPLNAISVEGVDEENHALILHYQGKRHELFCDPGIYLPLHRVIPEAQKWAEERKKALSEKRRTQEIMEQKKQQQKQQQEKIIPYLKDLLLELSPEDEVTVSQVYKVVSKEYNLISKEFLENTLKQLPKEMDNVKFMRLKEAIKRIK